LNRVARLKDTPVRPDGTLAATLLDGGGRLDEIPLSLLLFFLDLMDLLDHDDCWHLRFVAYSVAAFPPSDLLLFERTPALCLLSSSFVVT
jgi:hypothetical protein